MPEVFSEQQQPQLPIDRIVDTDLVLRDLAVCDLCHGILWYPVGCANCEKAYCSACIRTSHLTKSEPVCPSGCSTFTERNCPAAITRILAILKVICRYKSNGCTQTLSYDELEQHEKMCGYQLLMCDGCQQGIIKKDFENHKNECLLLLMTCDQCLTSYKRQYADIHTLTECLRIQLHQQKFKIEQLEKREVEQEKKMNLIEQKLNEFNSFWSAFIETTTQIKDMLDDADESLGYIKDLSV